MVGEYVKYLFDFELKFGLLEYSDHFEAIFRSTDFNNHIENYI